MRSKLFTPAILLLMLTSAVHAQELKIGYTNMDYILSLMPEYKQIEAELTAYEKQVQNQYQAKVQEFETKAQQFQQEFGNKQPGEINEVIFADRQKELQDMQVSIQQFEANAQQSLQQKQADLVAPAYEKIQKAIEEVAQELSYTHVFSAGNLPPVLLYAREEDNISDSVLKKLGITPPASN